MADIKIGVSAQPGNAQAVLDGIDHAAQGAAEAVEGLGKAGVTAAAGLGKVEAQMRQLDLSAKRLKGVASTLSKEFGRSVTPTQAGAFLQSYERMRSNRNLSGGAKIRQFDSFESWLAGNRQMFVSQHEAQRYKYRVLSMAASGAGISDVPAAPPRVVNPGEPSPPTPSTFDQGVQKAQNTAMSFGRGMLALAGLNSIMGLAGRSLDMATEESTGNDTLKRTLGDLNVGFDELKEQLRETGKGLGFASVEAVRMAQQFARTANAGPGTSISGEVRTAAGFSRSYGLDLAAGTQFFAQARALHQTSNETESKRLALMIAESIDKGHNTAKADEVLSAVSNFSTQVARLSLSTPNVEGFSGMLAGMTKSGIAGLDVSGASSIISRANDAVSHGGGMGEAGKNFTFYALGGGKGGLDPVQAMALAEGGLFGSSSSAFGPNSALGQYYGKNNLQLSSRTNLSKIRALLDSQYGNNKSLKLDAAKNYFGLNYNQAAAFLNVKPEQLGSLEPMLAQNGIKIDQLSATGYSQLAQVGSADAGGLHRIAAGMLARRDVSAGDKADLKAAEAGGPDALRSMLAKLTAKYEQEMTEGKKTANDIAGINQALTNSGSYLLAGVNAIKEGVLAIVNKTAPDSAFARRNAAQSSALQLSAGGHRALFDSATSQDIHDDAAQKIIAHRRSGDKLDKRFIDGIYKPSGADLRGDETAVNRRIAQWEEIRRQAGQPVTPGEMYEMYGLSAPKGAAAESATGNGSSAPGKHPTASSGGGSKRGVRNNNPGNLRTTRDNWLGKIGDDGAFVRFDSAEHGLRAMALNLRAKAKKNGSTVASIVSAWAPPSENDTPGYIAEVAKSMGVRSDQRIDLSDPDTMRRMMAAMIQRENGQMPYSATQLDAGIDSANPRLPGGRGALASSNGALSGKVHGSIDVNVNAGGRTVTHSLPVTLKPSLATAAGTTGREANAW